MRKRILITGLSGTGKTTNAKELSSRGYVAHDLESMSGMFTMYRRGSDALFADYDNEDPDKIRGGDWRCDAAALAALFDRQEEDIVFYCGVASDMRSLMSHFDRSYALCLPEEIHLERLVNRGGKGVMGATLESRKIILEWRHSWEDTMGEYGAHLLSAEGTPREVVERILESSRSLSI
ncbi:MAG: shikimate kinase [Parcubacteria group bacterium]|nr:shikimate kinase [Parcubacteria group bacterium]